MTNSPCSILLVGAHPVGCREENNSGIFWKGLGLLVICCGGYYYYQRNK